jgi:acetoin utilization protein AcuC
VTLPAFPRLYAMLDDLAFDAAGGRWLVLTGGGYNIDLLARLWALQLAQMTGADLPDEIPAGWLDLALARTGTPFTPRLREDAPFAVEAERRERADADGHVVVDQARAIFL